MKHKIKWLPRPEAHDYPAAASYLSLLFDKATVSVMIKKLRSAPVVTFKSKDIFRAADISLLGISNSHVQKDREKIRGGIKLSPLLLVRGNNKVIIADGYHRLCALYSYNENSDVPCKII